MPIRILPTHLVNKIAAGEVIERPASIVKELVENALDAGAERIEVAIEDGGRKSISVTDDGCGMNADDLALAFRPHATSKLTDEEDLFRIGTLGFRGEALASMASVSHAHIRSCPRAQGPADAGGFEIDASGPQIGQVRPCAAAPGTTVTVRDLFFNTPARRKFLRAANTEAGHIAEQITRLALPQPQVGFQLMHNGRTVHSLAPCEATLTRIGDLFGAELADALLPIAARGQGAARVSGLIAPPSAARGSGKWQYLFLNGRYIRDRLLAHAVREAYRGRIDPTRWPVVFIFVDIDPAEVDVNVHPTKIEVRFRDSQLVHGELLAALRETLDRANLAPTAELDATADSATSDEAQAGLEQRRASLRQALADFFKSTPPPQPRLSFPQGAPPRDSAGSLPRPGAGSPSRGALPFSPPQSHPAPPAAPDTHRNAPPSPVGPPAAVGTVPADSPRPAADAERPAGPATPRFGAIQVHNAYIVAPTEEGLVIIDQHALHERLIYNDLRRRLADAPLAAQPLLIPETLTVTTGEADCLQRHADLLGRLGIEVAAFGPTSAAVHRFPSLLVGRRVAIAPFIRELADRLFEDDTAEAEHVLEDVLAMMACKAAVKAGEPLAPSEIDALLCRREEAEKVEACPHGRPTALKLTLRDLEKQFRRT